MTSSQLASARFLPQTDDFVALHAIHSKKVVRDDRWINRLTLFFASWIATGVSLSTANALTEGSLATGAALSAVFIWVITSRMWPDPKKVALQQFRRATSPRLYQTTTISLEESGVRYITETTEYWYSWSIVHRVLLTEQHLFLVAGSATTVFVPLRAFTSHESFLDFATIAQGRYTPKPDEQPSIGFPVVQKT